MQMQSKKQRDAFKALLDTFTFQDDPEAEIIGALSEWCELKDDNSAEAHHPALVENDLIQRLMHHAEVVTDAMQVYADRDPAQEVADERADYLRDIAREA